MRLLAPHQLRAIVNQHCFEEDFVGGIPVTVLAGGNATSGSTTTIADTTQAWVTNQWAGYSARIVGGAGGTAVRQIASNTSTTLTLAVAGAAAADNTTLYQIEGAALNPNFGDRIPTSTSLPNGVLKAAHAADNNSASVVGVVDPAIVAANRPIEFMARLAVGSDAATTNQANLFAGMVDATVGATAASVNDFITDNGAAILSSFTGFGIYKLDSGAAGTTAPLRVITSVGSSQTTTVTNAYLPVAVAAGSFVTLAVSFYAKSITEVEVTFRIDTDGGENLTTLQDANGRQIKHRVDFTASNGVLMRPLLFHKTGAATASQTLFDFVSVTQNRFLV